MPYTLHTRVRLWRWAAILLTLAVVFVCLGRGLQLLLFEHSFAAFFYHDILVRPFILLFTDLGWEDYLGNTAINEKLESGARYSSLLLLVSLPLFIGYHQLTAGVQRSLSIIAGSFLLFIAFCQFLSHGFRLIQFFEYAAQFGSPILLYLYYNKEPEKFLRWIKILIALTFTSHGLYALGLYPTPSQFIDMLIVSLGIEEYEARWILKVVGWLDLICSAGLFLKNRLLFTFSLYYLLLWGSITTFGRVLTGWQLDISANMAAYWGVEFLYRIPHILLPLTLFLLAKNSVEEELRPWARGQRTPG